MIFNKKITIQQQDPDTEEWKDRWSLRASINKTGGGQSYNADADQYRATLTFTVRHFKSLQELRFNPQPFRILYGGHAFKLTDYDDFQEQHRIVKLVGVAYG